MWQHHMSTETPCVHAMQIADALACHDFPGMPSLGELDTGIQEAYIRMGEAALLKNADHRDSRGIGEV